MKPVAILYEHPEWFRPLFAELDRRGLPYEAVHAARLSFDPDEAESPYSLVVNRMSPSAWTRGHADAIFTTAHYLAYLLIDGENTLAVIVDPFAQSWNPLGLGEYGLWKGIAPAGAIWWLQILVIVWGHVAAVFAAHRLALRRSTRLRALASQAPLVGLMVLYTVAGLWVLAQQLKA